MQLFGVTSPGFMMRTKTEYGDPIAWTLFFILYICSLFRTVNRGTMYPGSVASCGGLLEEGTYPVEKPNHKNGHQSQNMLNQNWNYSKCSTYKPADFGWWVSSRGWNIKVTLLLPFDGSNMQISPSFKPLLQMKSNQPVERAYQPTVLMSKVIAHVLLPLSWERVIVPFLSKRCLTA